MVKLKKNYIFYYNVYISNNYFIKKYKKYSILY